MRNENGQVALLSLGLLLTLTLVTLGFMHWARKTLWQMRIDLTADAVALSVARSQAEALNTISSLNSGTNLFVKKAHIPIADTDAAEMQLENRPPYEANNGALRTELLVFSRVPASIGSMVAKQIDPRVSWNYFPRPMRP